MQGKGKGAPAPGTGAYWGKGAPTPPLMPMGKGDPAAGILTAAAPKGMGHAPPCVLS